MQNPKEIVRKGYDRLGPQYRKHFTEIHGRQYIQWITGLMTLLSNNGTILELGCNDGLPVGSMMSRGHAYTGVDLSGVQIGHARKNVPSGTFIEADMTDISFAPRSFDAVVALYSIIHVPVHEQFVLLNSIGRWLRPGGHFMCTVGAHEWTGTEAGWIDEGTEMYWSHTNAAQYERWFTSLGFTILQHDFIAEGKGGHTLFLLRK